MSIKIAMLADFLIQVFSIFYLLQVVDCVSKTQFQVG